MVDKLLKIQINIQGRDVEISDAGPTSPGFYGIDDPVHINGQKATPPETFQVLQNISSITSIPALGLPFHDLSYYLDHVTAIHESQYPTPFYSKETTVTCTDCLTFGLSTGTLNLPINPDDGHFTVPEILDLHLQAKCDILKLTALLKTWPEEKRLELLHTLITGFAFRPIRTYQKDEKRRFAEMIVGYFIWHMMEPDGPTSPFPIKKWITDQTGGQLKRQENKEGLKYITRLTKEASMMKETHPSQMAYFSNPNRLALLLRALVAPKSIYHENIHRYYHETPDYANIVAERIYSFGTVVFYSIDHIYPTEEVIDTVAAELEMTEYEVDYNPVLNVIFTPDRHGARISIAEQNYTGDPLPGLLGFYGDYIKIGLDPHRIPTCTVNHEVGHQKYWQLAEDELGTIGPKEQSFINKLHSLYEEAMKTDGGEIINDSTYTGLLFSGHPYKFVEFYPALRHAYVEHGNEFLKRINETPKNHYARKLWGLMKEIYRMDFTSQSNRQTSSGGRRQTVR